MKKTRFFALAVAVMLIASCGGSKDDKKDLADQEKKVNETPARNNGYFLMHYSPLKSMFISEFGKEFSKLDTCKSWVSHISSDAAGTLYASPVDLKLGVIRSTDNGKTWNPAANNYAGKTENATYAIAAGKAKSVYALSSHGDFYVSSDGGDNWEKRTSPCVKNVPHKSPAMGIEAYLAVSADGKKILAQAWFFEETVLAVSEDEGKTWSAIPAPTERNSSKGIGFCSDRIVYASYDQLFYTDDLGKTWFTSTPEKLVSKGSESSFYGYRHFVTDGDLFVVGVEAPAAERSRDAKNKYPGAIFFSKDAGKTFEVLAFPHSVDPTPTVSDETVFLTFVPKKKS
ncbi:MAG: hypothetical protein A2W93_13010 [Bacteroidetes bacterium GWF2_43_63]|nr:MAG: hypothetical protein A2W94_03595 [Bacteroidetes bacterium GWE2_42_42]OFY55104.1 MAG: hypothetical protein A2W93_13010 [Bacteroidetes bacterium GWF2_43_63]HBG70279.1 hypothetical protein [Bacteroidales bacterium]HCB63049.1 hypothetical protein [Bacteroidales bacterium]HCY22732.1 hypothetical protein [Bacteroidales bacterium]